MSSSTASVPSKVLAVGEPHRKSVNQVDYREEQVIGVSVPQTSQRPAGGPEKRRPKRVRVVVIIGGSVAGGGAVAGIVAGIVAWGPLPIAMILALVAVILALVIVLIVVGRRA
jgi:hypothetical protein